LVGRFDPVPERGNEIAVCHAVMADSEARRENFSHPTMNGLTP